MGHSVIVGRMRRPVTVHRKRLLRLFSLGVVLFLVLDVILLVVFFDSSSTTVDQSKLITLDFPSAESDQLWLSVLQHGTIVRSDFFKPAGSAISEKHILILSYEGRLYKTMAKLVQPTSAVGLVPRMIDADIEGDDNIFRRADRDFQAFPEIASYHVDRVLGIYRKPVFMSRVVTNKILYRNMAWFPSWNIGRIVRSISYKFSYFAHEYNIYISLQPWMDGLSSKPPSLEVKNYMVFRTRDVPRDPAVVKELIEVSDTLVFDVLVDEHDRKAEKNWVVAFNDVQLLWDNGLAFDHGPQGRAMCLDILCGHNQWINAGDKSKPCERICRFSRATYERLQQYSRAEESKTIGNLLQQHVNRDLLGPLLHFAKYEHYKDDGDLVSFKVDNFWKGMQVKLDRVLDHMNYCISRYGERQV